MNDLEAMKQVLWDSLQELSDAVKALCEPVYGAPKVRFRKFRIVRGVVWPVIVADTDVSYPRFLHDVFDEHCQSQPIAYFPTTEYILDICNGNPRSVAHAVNQLRAAARWCRARDAGRRRAAQHNRESQKSVIEKLEAEAAVIALSKGRGVVDNG